MNTAPNHFRKSPTGPPVYVRLSVYLILWLAPVALLVLTVPRFEPIFQKLEKVGQMPELTEGIVAFVRMNETSYYMPLLAVLLAFFSIDAGIVVVLRQRKQRNFFIWFWFCVACCIPFVFSLLIVWALLAPVYKMSSAVG